MQLKKQIGLAVGALLSVTSLPSIAEDWLIDSSVLNYSEKDSQGQSRVNVLEPVLSVTKQNAPDDFFNVQLVYDTLSGASPNGGFASSNAQTFSGPSGNGGYTVPAGLTPLDPNFKDARTALSLSWMTPLDRFSRYQGGLHFSKETDYTSVGGSYTYLQDFNNKLTTLNLGVAYSYDTVNPTGGFHNGLTSTASASSTTGTSGTSSSESDEGNNLMPGKPKNTVDAIIGITQVYNRYTLMNLNYGITQVSGYQTDPYKIVPIINVSGFPVDYVYEKRPDSRLKQTIKFDVAEAIGKDSLHLSYRYYWDDWGVKAHTYDAKYHLSLGERFYLEPHYRLSNQLAANFYRLSLLNTSTTPKYASSDVRLADMKTETVGGMIGFRLTRDTSLTLNMEEMTQTGNSYSNNAIGDQKLHDMFPTVKASIVTLGIRTKW